METVGAVVSIVQIAHFGAQLSLKLYELAEAVRSANKDVQYVAKDIALFSTVLKDLGNTLSRGQKSRLYKDDAYQTSLLIAKECEEVFKEIQQILKKPGIEGITTDTISIGRKEKFLWMFHKSRVQILRGKLESLKSTILLQVAVLGYADTLSSSLNPATNGDDFLALKSLVLADETIKTAFEKLKLSEGSSVENPIPLPDDATNVPDSESNHPASTKSTAARTPKRSQPLLSTPHATFDPKSYTEIWNRADRLELALRNIETAKWEYERLRINISKTKHRSRAFKKQAEENEEKAKILRVKRSLSEFGLSKEKANQALASVVIPGSSTGMRTQTEHSVPRNDTLFATLQYFGASWEPDKERPNFWTIKRWMPCYLEDILCEHTAQVFTKAMWRDRGTPAESLRNISGSEPAHSAREESQKSVQQAIQYVQQYDADTEQKEHLQGPPVDFQQNEIKSIYTNMSGSRPFEETEVSLPQETRIDKRPGTAMSLGAQSKFPRNLFRLDSSTLDSPPRSPAIKDLSTPWSSEDDTLLMHARQNSFAWELIATKYFPSKTANTCRKRHERLMEKRNSLDSWDGTGVELLANAYISCRERMWEILGGRLGEKWQDVESKCMQIGIKKLQKTSQTYACQKKLPQISFFDDCDEIHDQAEFLSSGNRCSSEISDFPESRSLGSTTNIPAQVPLYPKKSARTSVSIPSIVVDFSPDLPHHRSSVSSFSASIPETNRIPPPYWSAAGVIRECSPTRSSRRHPTPQENRGYILQLSGANHASSRASLNPPPLSLGKRKFTAERMNSIPEQNPARLQGAMAKHTSSFQAQNGDRVSNIVQNLLRRWTFLDDRLVLGSAHGLGYQERGGDVEGEREEKRIKEI